MTANEIEAIKDQHEATILRILNNWRREIESAGYATCEPFDQHDECFSWSFGIWGQVVDPEHATDGDPIADCSITIAESGPYAGDRLENGDSEGINLISDLVEFGGRILGGFSPFNYSDRVWTDDPAEFAERVKMFESIDPVELAGLLEKID